MKWAHIIAMRNRVIHAYDEIDLSIIWTTVRTTLPSLLLQVRQFLETDELPSAPADA